MIGEPACSASSALRCASRTGPATCLPSWTDDELQETDPLEATLPADESIPEGYVPVQFHPKVTELGMFELWCYSTKSDGRWKLEFSVREE